MNSKYPQPSSSWRIIDTFTQRPIQPGKIYLFFIIALLVYVCPVIQANYPYIDDHWRRISAATNWQQEGRAGGNILIHLLSAGTGTPDLFPLTLFFAIGLLALALMRLAQHWFLQPTPVQLLILLPFWYNPFYLQVLAYHYEALTITTGIAFVILAVVTCQQVGWLRWGGAILLLTAAVSFYQLIINVYIGLVSVEILRRGVTGISWREDIKLIARYIIILAGAVLIYYLTFYQMITVDRGGVQPFDGKLLVGRMETLFSLILLFITPVNAWVFIPLGILAGIGFFLHYRERAGLNILFIRFLALSTLVFAIGGVNILLTGFNTGARTLLGVSPLLCAIMWFSWRALAVCHHRSTLLIALPLWVFLSFASLFGQHLSDKKQSEHLMVSMLVPDIINHPTIYQASEIILVSKNNIQDYFVKSVCLNQLYPALNYIASTNYILMPEQLTQAGITNMARYWSRHAPPVATGEVVVENPFYRIKQEGDMAFIEFKKRNYTQRCFSYPAQPAS